MTLTIAHQQLLRDALKEKTARPIVTPEQRAAIRQICKDTIQGAEPEKLLIAFKIALVKAAEDAGIPFGVERSAIVSGLVSVFIEELYAAGCGEQIEAFGTETPASAPRIILKDDSPDAHI
ncbi:MAG TPA: hypothetical protein VJ840_04600 [Gemmatimonadaceae bacterium]|nr:hypothetical protein [Gemmatimonadaceae bacterium]